MLVVACQWIGIRISHSTTFDCGGDYSNCDFDYLYCDNNEPCILNCYVKDSCYWTRFTCPTDGISTCQINAYSGAALTYAYIYASNSGDLTIDSEYANNAIHSVRCPSNNKCNLIARAAGSFNYAKIYASETGKLILRGEINYAWRYLEIFATGGVHDVHIRPIEDGNSINPNLFFYTFVFCEWGGNNYQYCEVYYDTTNQKLACNPSLYDGLYCDVDVYETTFGM